MSWKYIDDLLLKLSKNSTWLGKLWVVSVLLLRLLVLTAFGEHIWSDEQREFTCNTKQPGCENVCFNIFTPISNVRLWGMQMLAVSVPAAFYFLYVLHAMSRNKIITTQSARITSESDDSRAAEDACNETECKPSPENKKPVEGARKRWKLLSGHVIPQEINKSRVQFVWSLYLFQIVLRVVFEVLFSLLQYEIYFYKWTVPEVFACSRWPCPHTVDCFISRPREKTVLFRYMYVISGISVVMSVAELVYIGWTRCRKSCEKKQKSKTAAFNFGHSRLKNTKPNIYFATEEHFKSSLEKFTDPVKLKTKSRSFSSTSQESTSDKTHESDVELQANERGGFNRISYL